MENKLTTKNVILNYGLILGVVAIFLSLIQYALGEHLEPKPVYGIVSVIITIVVTVIAIKNYKKTNDGYLSFGEAVKLGVGISLISGIIAILYNYIFMTFIEPNFLDMIMAKQEQMMYDKGMEEKQVEAAMNMAKKFKSPLISSAFGLIASAFIGFVISAITGAVLKKSRIEA